MFNKKEVEIIKHLRENGRKSLTDMAKATELPLSTMHAKMQKISQNVQHTTLVNFNHLGYFARHIIAIKIGQERKKELEEHLQNSSCINNLQLINNGYDFLVESVCMTKAQFKEYVSNLINQFDLDDIRIFEILEDKKREAFQP